MGEALRRLEKTFLIQLVYPTTETTLPLMPDQKKSPRLQILDTGLMNFFAGYQNDLLGSDNLNSVYHGKIIKHLIGQEILAIDSSVFNRLNFWVRDKSESKAEVDFIYVFHNKIIPIEVKSGREGRLRSLLQFMDRVNHNMAVRFYAGKFNLQLAKTPSGKSFYLLNLPYFLGSQSIKYLDWMEQTIQGA